MMGAHEALTTESNHKEILAWGPRNDKAKRGNSTRPDKASVNRERGYGGCPAQETLGRGGARGEGPSPRFRCATPPPCPPGPLSYQRSMATGHKYDMLAPKAPEIFVPFAGDPRECKGEVATIDFEVARWPTRV